MPDRVEVQDLTCPAGTTSAAPVEVAITGVVACSVERLTILIPPGHALLTGIAFGYGHQPVLPRTAGRFISGDDEVIVYDMTNYPDGPQWQAFLINADTNPHGWEVRFEVDELPATAASPVSAPLALPEIYAVGSALIGAG
jgi:hypothetical protein